MIRLKAIVVLFLSTFLFLFMACSDDDSSSSVRVYSFSDRAAVATTGGMTGTVIKNKAAFYTDGLQYYEYLTFTSEEAGSYAIYKDTNGVLTKVESIDATGSDGEERSFLVPSDFVYEPNTGKVALGTTNTFLFKTDSAYFVASYQLFPKSEGEADEGDTALDGDKGLFDTWVTSDKKNTFTIQEDGYIRIQLGGSGTRTTKPFYNDGGFIASLDESAGGTAFLYLNLYGENKLFWMAYIAQITSAEGRAVKKVEGLESLDGDKAVIEFSSNNFIFWQK